MKGRRQENSEWLLRHSKLCPKRSQTRAARPAVAAIVSYQILLIALILGPDLAPCWHTISQLAVGPYGWTMSGAFLISAPSYAAPYVTLKSQLHGIEAGGAGDSAYS